MHLGHCGWRLADHPLCSLALWPVARTQVGPLPYRETSGCLQDQGASGWLQMVRQVFPPAEHRQEMSPQDQQQLQLVLGGGLGLRDETPIFILGMARSGSTLLEQILASHSWGHGAGTLRCSLHFMHRHDQAQTHL